jgi:ubiquinone/menaquinone biosynthesis C-methylase UbiE
MKINQKYFSNRNKELSKNCLEFTNKRHQKSIEIINHLLKIKELTKIDHNSNLLDVGSGDGSFVKFLNSKNIKSTGCDINEADLEKDLLPYESSSFSHVLLYAVIEHIKNTDHLLTEIKRILIKKGTFILITPNFRFCYDTFYDDPTHVKPFTDKSIYHLLKIMNFEKIIVKPWTSNLFKVIWKLPFAFFYCAKIIPFRNDNSFKWLPSFLKGKSKTLVAVCQKK